jgi:hypothetical protein
MRKQWRTPFLVIVVLQAVINYSTSTAPPSRIANDASRNRSFVAHSELLNVYSTTFPVDEHSAHTRFLGKVL